MVTGHPEMFFLMHVCICVVAIFHFDWSHKLEEDQRLITAEVVVLTCQTQLTFQSVPLLPFSFVVKEEPRNQKIPFCVLYREVTVGSCWTASCTVTTAGSQTKEELFGVFAASVCKKKEKRKTTNHLLTKAMLVVVSWVGFPTKDLNTSAHYAPRVGKLLIRLMAESQNQVCHPHTRHFVPELWSICSWRSQFILESKLTFVPNAIKFHPDVHEDGLCGQNLYCLQM